LVTETGLKRLKIDVVNGLPEIRRRHAVASLEEIERVVAEVLKKCSGDGNDNEEPSRRHKIIGCS